MASYEFRAQNIPKVNYDEQVGITFDYGSSILKWNVTAIAQNESYGYGPAYLLNGLTDEGWWYQIGIAYNWPFINGGYSQGFYLIYEIWDSTGNSVYPQNGSGLQNFNGLVKNNDLIELRLFFQGNNITMEAYDWNTTASAFITYPSHGSKFIGSLDGGYGVSNINGFFTGLMTEQYHVYPYYGDLKPVFYTAKGVKLSNVWLWIDEFSSATKQVLFANAGYFYLGDYPNSFRGFFYQGLGQFIAGNRTGYATYITGSQGIVAANFAYRIIGGGNGYSRPLLQIHEGNAILNMKLNNTLYGLIVNQGSTWNVNPILNGSTKFERWTTIQQNGTLNDKIQDIFINYYHQFKVPFIAKILNGGKPEIKVNYTSFGEKKQNYFNFTDWVDAGSTYNSTNIIVNNNERWITNSSTGIVIENSTVMITYYHQYEVQFLYNVVGKNYQTPPKVIFTYLGTTNSSLANNTKIWVDAYSQYIYQPSLNGSNNEERWIAYNYNGTVKEPANITVIYFHQFYVELGTNYEDAGNLNLKSGWYNESQELNVIAYPNPGWELYTWSGYGEGSYNGSGIAKIIVKSPLRETAIFYAIVEISISGQGSVIYKLGNVQVETNNQTILILAPPNATLILKAIPSSNYYFVSWEINGKTINNDQITIPITSPINAKVTFNSYFNFQLIILLISALLIIAILVIVIYKRLKSIR